jgi:molybdate transport system substrate-binding protein
MTAIRVLCTFGLRQVVEILAPTFEQQHHCTVERHFNSSVAHMQHLAEGKSADVAVFTDAAIDELIADGRMERRVDFARSGVGLAVKAGAPKPDISTPEKFKAALLAAESIARSKTGASGLYFVDLIARIGMADALKDKIIIHDGLTGECAARGEAELAVQQVSELMQAKGVDIVGPLPGDLQSITVFSGGVFKGAPPLAEAFIAFLSTPEAAAVIHANGMDPV